MFNVLCVIQVNPSLRQVCVCVCAGEKAKTQETPREKESVCSGVMDRFIKFCSSDNIPAAVGVERLLTHS